MACSPAIELGRFHCLPLYDSLATAASWLPHVKVRLTNAAYRRLLGFWAKLSSSDCGVTWEAATPAEVLFTDASDVGFGAHLSLVSPEAVVSG